MELIIEFFKELNMYDENYFNIIKANTKILNSDYEDIKDFVGCYKIGEDKFKLILPKIKNKLDLLIYVHEYSHALFLDDELEIFPNIMEALFINKYFDKEEKIKILNNENKSCDFNHYIGVKVKKRMIVI